MRRSAALVLFFSCLVSAPETARAGDGAAAPKAYASKEHGFRFEAPDPSWSVEEAKDASKGLSQVVCFPAGWKGKVQFTVRVHAPPPGAERPAALRDRTLAWTQDKPAYANRSKVEREVAGRAAPGLQVDLTQGGETFRVQQFYLVEASLAFTVGWHAPVAAFDERRPVFEKTCATFAFTAREGAAADEAALDALAARCGTEIPWEAEWKAAADRARGERRLVLVLVREAGGFNTADAFTRGAFMDPDVVALVRARFVALRFRKGMGAPFESHEVYGLGPSTFGTSLLVTTPEGRVVGDTFCPEPSTVLELLADVLARNRDRVGVTPPQGLFGAALARWLLERGEHETCANVLASPSTAEEYRLRAALGRRLRRGEEALADLDAASRLPDPGSAADLDMDRAVLLIRTGKPADAYAVLASVLDRHPGHARAPEARYWLGVASFPLAGAKAAGGEWRALVAAHPESRWSWAAAAILTGPAFQLGVGGRTEWPEPEVLATLRLAPVAPLPAAKARRAEGDAVEYLLAGQRSDGSWICSTEAAGASDRVPGDLTVAVTGLAGLSLVPFREDPRVRRALHLAAGFIRRAQAAQDALGARVTYMDYGVWSKACALWFLAAGADAGVFDREAIRPLMEAQVRGLRDRQKARGGWSYYVTRDLKSSTPANQTISFCTAGALLALAAGAKAGVAVPEDMIADAVGVLERMRNADGTFEYMLFHGNEKAPRTPNESGAAGRGPLCALALHRFGRSDLDAIRTSLAVFARHRASYAALRRKTLMHTAAGGQGSHYLAFDAAAAALALSELPALERAHVRGTLLDFVLGLRGADGSFVDNPMIGPHGATALALVALGRLRNP